MMKETNQDVRQELVSLLRAAIQEGGYPTEAMLEYAVNKMIQDLQKGGVK